MVTIYYGMSGTLKLSSILALHRDDFKVLSDNKRFFEMDEMYFNWSGRVNDSHLAIHRILMLDTEGYLPVGRDIAIERGVTDMAFHIPMRKLSGLSSYSDIRIPELVQLERDIITCRAKTRIRKVLLVMNDEDFIEKKVINNRFRKAVYPDVKSYMSHQREYIDFTTKYNVIDETTEINDAKEYITHTLNVEYEE